MDFKKGDIVVGKTQNGYYTDEVLDVEKEDNRLVVKGCRYFYLEDGVRFATLEEIQIYINSRNRKDLEWKLVLKCRKTVSLLSNDEINKLLQSEIFIVTSQDLKDEIDEITLTRPKIEENDNQI